MAKIEVNSRVVFSGSATDNIRFGRDGASDEEVREVAPAVEELRQEGYAVTGPIGADSVFHQAAQGRFNSVLSLYHDQGHIPLKVIGFVYDAAARKWQSVSGVNITLGLPIIRTSVDHGTAFDQAGKGTATETSLLNAMDYAISFANHRADLK